MSLTSLVLVSLLISIHPVSYTHLDVYKRQLSMYGMKQSETSRITVVVVVHVQSTSGLNGEQQVSGSL